MCIYTFYLRKSPLPHEIKRVKVFKEKEVSVAKDKDSSAKKVGLKEKMPKKFNDELHAAPHIGKNISIISEKVESPKPLPRPEPLPPKPKPIYTDRSALKREISSIQLLSEERPGSHMMKRELSNSSSVALPVVESERTIPRPRKKKKSWLGISGYQRIGDTPMELDGDSSSSMPIPFSVDVNLMGIDLLPSNSAAGSVDGENMIPTPHPFKIKSREAVGFVTTINPINPHPEVAVTASLPIPISCEKKDQSLSLKGLPFHTFARSNLEIRFVVDLQIALFLGMKSGRALIEQYPSLSTKVVQASEKLLLEKSLISTIILAAMLENGANPRWLKTVSNEWGTGLALSGIDLAFLEVSEVMKIEEIATKYRAYQNETRMREYVFGADGTLSAAEASGEYVHKLKRK